MCTFVKPHGTKYFQWTHFMHVNYTLVNFEGRGGGGRREEGGGGGGEPIFIWALLPGHVLAELECSINLQSLPGPW